MTRLTVYEQETTVNIPRGEKTAYIYSSDPVVIRRLDRLCKEQPSVYSCTKTNFYMGTEEVCSKEYEIAEKRLIRFAKKREFTEEQLAELKERGQKLFRKRQEAMLEEDVEDIFEEE